MYILEYKDGVKPEKLSPKAKANMERCANFLVKMIDKYGKEKEAVYRKWCKQNPEEFHLAPGAVEFLDYIKANNIPHTIATMSEWDNVEFYIKEFRLERWFDLDKIVFSDGTIPGKPAPDIFLAIDSVFFHEVLFRGTNI